MSSWHKSDWTAAGAGVVAAITTHPMAAFVCGVILGAAIVAIIW